MRLCLVSETYPPEVNGVALTVHALAMNCQTLGHGISIVRPERPNEIKVERTTIVELTVKSGQLPKYPSLRFGYPNYRAIYAHLQQFRPDVVYIATEGPLGWSASIAARRLNIIVISGFHTRFDTYMCHYGLPWLKGLAFQYLRTFHRRSAFTVVPTIELKEELNEKGLTNVIHIPRGVDTDRFNPAHRDSQLRSRWGVNESDPVLICVGRIAAEKNLSLLFESYRKALSHTPRLRLVLVGDGPQRAQLEAENADVIFTGTLLGAELSRAYASADLFALPSLSETFGNVTLEAMASGLSVIAFDYGAARAHVVHGLHGSTVSRNDHSAFLSAVSFEVSRWQLGARVGADARQSALRLNPRRLAEEFIQHISTQLIQAPEQRHDALEPSLSKTAKA
jgi:glycosyltransferase involved in cell wall biosynthesis